MAAKGVEWPRQNAWPNWPLAVLLPPCQHGYERNLRHKQGRNHYSLKFKEERIADFGVSSRFEHSRKTTGVATLPSPPLEASEIIQVCQKIFLHI
jgi:hypothetical protein